MKSGSSDLTRGPVGSTLLLFALPTLATSVVQSLNASVNAAWVGRLLGEDALAATTNGHIIMGLLYSFVLGFGMAAMILVGQAFGREDLRSAKKVLGSAVGGFLPLVIGLAAIGWLAAPWLLRLMATPETSLPLALAYLRVIFIALPGGMMMIMLMTMLRGAGDAVTPSLFMVFAVAIDVALNPVFILGLGPAPRLGIAGSSTAAALSCYLTLAAMIGYAYWRKFPLRLTGLELGYLRPDPALVRPIFGKGFPMGLQMIVMAVSALAMLGLVNRQGVTTTAAYAVIHQLWNYVHIPSVALAAAVTAMAAQNIGAGKWERVSAATRAGVILSVAVSVLIVGVLLIGDRAIISLFVDAASASIPMALHIQLLSTWGHIFMGVALILFATVRANGMVYWPLLILFIAFFPIRLGIAVLGAPWLGANALWLSFPISMIAAAFMAAVLYLHGAWREGRVLVEPTD